MRTGMRFVFLFVLVFAAACGGSDGPGNPGTEHEVRYGFTAFPYDFTPEAVEQTYRLIFANSNLHAIHLDDCVNWAELAENRPINSTTQGDWDGEAQRIPYGTHQVLVQLAPTTTDRRTINFDCESIAEGRDPNSGLPAELVGAPLDHPRAVELYLAYAERVIAQFRPTYINLGIEMGETVLDAPDTFQQFARLYRSVRTELKQRHPDLQITFGNSPYVLLTTNPSSGQPFAEDVRSLVADSDFLGLSFYPDASGYFELVRGTDPIPLGRDGWRTVLDRMRQLFPNTPLAITDTGLTSETVTLPSFGNITLPGSTESNRAWTEDLVTWAKKDRYLFVMWFNAIDYDPIWDTMTGVTKEINALWKNTGLWAIPSDYPTTPDPVAKPALAEWQRFQP